MASAGDPLAILRFFFFINGLFMLFFYNFALFYFAQNVKGK